MARICASCGYANEDVHEICRACGHILSDPRPKPGSKGPPKPTGPTDAPTPSETARPSEASTRLAEDDPEAPDVAEVLTPGPTSAKSKPPAPPPPLKPFREFKSKGDPLPPPPPPFERLKTPYEAPQSSKPRKPVKSPVNAGCFWLVVIFALAVLSRSCS